MGNRTYSFMILVTGFLFSSAVSAEEMQEIVVTATSLQEGDRDPFVTVISQEDIRQSSATTIPDILNQIAGVQTRDFFGTPSRNTLDLRGHGAVSSQNTIVLVDGLQQNEMDFTGINYLSLSPDNMEKIDVIRGSAGSVLYGEGAVGGVVNIKTRKRAKEEFSGELGALAGSYGLWGSNLSLAKKLGPYSLRAYGSTRREDGYRRHNELSQEDVSLLVHHDGVSGEAFVKADMFQQTLNMPGSRTVTSSSSQFASDPRGTSTPSDFDKRKKATLSFGGTKALSDTADLKLEGGLKLLNNQALEVNANAGLNSYMSTDMISAEVKPKLERTHTVFGNESEQLVGLDLRLSTYQSDRKPSEFANPDRLYSAQQREIGLFGQETVALSNRTTLTVGTRGQFIQFFGKERIAAQTQQDENLYYALNLGLEHGISVHTTLYGRVGRGFRAVKIDERTGPTGLEFNLKPQAVVDGDFGIKGDYGSLRYQSNLFVMETHNEIRFNPTTFANENFPNIVRYGIENSGTYRVTDALKFIGSLTYINAKFVEGPNKGKQVPLVSPLLLNGAAYWNVEKHIDFSIAATYVTEKRLDNDDQNTQPKIPGYTLLDAKVQGTVDYFNWQVAVKNILNKKYFSYGTASSTTQGTYNVYPLPGITFIAGMGVKF
ncbi:MAG: TonB-dependent receptor [Alphaproteobacteria bacterium]|nr:TonB-dependent receptor [Alphaproteobacteria bacterium]MBT5389580.1 TonB-dependent receptor [Alphaproteobacteria bacterium]MBT5540870.1 TonB-dependent receptor [Alphaproteobacteria bacterium]MBT5654504.1 TonB-dependent receptor [Alphaproteobacteria bacterium]